MPDIEAGDDRRDGSPVLEVALWRLAEQIRAIEGLDSKAERVFGAALAMVTLAAAGVTFIVDQGDDSASNAALAAGVPVVVAFLWTTLNFVRGYRMSGWELGPTGNELLSIAGSYGDAQVRLWSAEALIYAYDNNRGRLERKADMFNSELTGLLVEIASLLVGIAAVAAFRVVAENAG